MKTEFYSELAKYFNHIRKRGLSVNTIATYRECFKHFILFLKEEKNKRKFFLEDLNYENVISWMSQKTNLRRQQPIYASPLSVVFANF